MLFIEPCLPTISRTVPTGPQWAYEIKHDGFRHLPPGATACGCSRGTAATGPTGCHCSPAEPFHSRQARRLADSGHHLCEARINAAPELDQRSFWRILRELSAYRGVTALAGFPQVPPVVVSSGPVLPCGWFWPSVDW